MSSEIQIKMGEFNSSVSSLTNSVLNTNLENRLDKEFEKTNIKPFTEDLQITIEALDLLLRYKHLLLNDVTKLKKVGEKIVEIDNQLAHTNESNQLCD